MKSKTKLIILSVILAILLAFMSAMVLTALFCSAATNFHVYICMLFGGISLIATTAAWTNAFFAYRHKTAFSDNAQSTDNKL